MRAHLETIVYKFGRNRAICLVEEAICAKCLQTFTDRQTDDGRRAILYSSCNDADRCRYVMLDSFIGHVMSDVFVADSVDTTSASLAVVHHSALFSELHDHSVSQPRKHVTDALFLCGS